MLFVVCFRVDFGSVSGSMAMTVLQAILALWNAGKHQQVLDLLIPIMVNARYGSLFVCVPDLSGAAQEPARPISERGWNSMATACWSAGT